MNPDCADVLDRGDDASAHPARARHPSTQQTVGAHLSRAGAVREGAGEELAGGRQVPLLGHQDVDDLPALVDRSIQVDSSTGDFDVGFVDEPAIAWSVPARLSRIDEQRCKPLHPPIHGDMVHLDVASARSSSTSRYDGP